jgi:hypothetical protein
MASIGITMVDHSPYDTMVQGLSLVVASGTAKANGKKHYRIMTIEVAQW